MADEVVAVDEVHDAGAEVPATVHLPLPLYGCDSAGGCSNDDDDIRDNGGGGDDNSGGDSGYGSARAHDDGPVQMQHTP
ncbi:MAG: hypothetical protein BGO69_11450 [Bacteroidetes bacterium 46-16]|nr:MAG: hypothetical protein BGO69_11450 [Bacteroidetes bacterium 46-16]